MKFNKNVLQYDLNNSYKILINTLTGAIDVAPVQLLNNINIKNSQLLEERGYFDIENKEKLMNNIYKLYKNKNENIPYWFYITLTYKCNFACPICYERTKLTKEDIDTNILDKILLDIRRFQKERKIPNERMNIILFGGEPLCVEDIGKVSRILEFCKSNGMKAIIVTNGSRVNKNVNIFNNYSEQISQFRITIDGPKETHDIRRPYIGGQSSYDDVINAIKILLKNGHSVKVQTIVGRGNIDKLEEIINIFTEEKFLDFPKFSWRLEASHDYNNLDENNCDEITEGKIVCKIIDLYNKNPELRHQIKFESFKYLGHITDSFGWMGKYKTYSGAKFSFCEPQKGYHYIYSLEGGIYHCPVSVKNENFYVGDVDNNPKYKINNFCKTRTILNDEKCYKCKFNTLCGGGCIVQKRNHKKFNCQGYANHIISEFIDKMKEEILSVAKADEIISINIPWVTINPKGHLQK
ncbi:MAG: radical SAM protein [Ignavibacteriales bacterium]